LLGSNPGQGKYFDLVNGTVLGDFIATPDDAKIEDIGNGWYRCSITTTSTSTSTVFQAYVASTGTSATFAGNDTDGILVWQAQLELGSVATSPIVTTAGTASRVADAITLTSASSLIGQTVFSIFAEYDLSTFTASDNACLLALTDGTADHMAVLRTQTDGDVELYVRAGGADQATIASTVDNGVIKVGYRVKSNDGVLYIDGVSIGTDVSVTVPALDRFQIGGTIATYAPIGRPFHMRALAAFQDLSDAQLDAITT
jgi:hypothetical protein